MILDANLLFSKDQKITTSKESSVIDLQSPGDAIGQELTIRVTVTENFAGLSTLQVKLQTSGDNSTWEDVIMTPAIPVAKLKAGKEIFKVRTPSGLNRYVRLNYVTSGTANAGAVYAYLSKEL